MANKRTFKKSVAEFGASLAESIMLAYYTNDGISQEATNTCVGRILDATEEAIRNSNVFFDRGPRAFQSHEEYARAKKDFFRALFQKINKDLEESVNAAIKDFNESLPAAVKEENKKLAAEEA